MIQIVMGKPGAGKSTYLALMARRSLSKGIPVYSNVYISGAFQLSISDLNSFLIKDSLIIIDEAGFEFNSRNFKRFTDNMYRFFSLHRHYNCTVILAVQYWDRLDIVIRELTSRITVVLPSIFSLFHVIRTRDILCKIDISVDKQISETFSWNFFSTRYYLGSRAFALFNSFYCDDLPLKDFSLY